jgi:uncharacterized protein (DUF58 family)
LEHVSHITFRKWEAQLEVSTIILTNASSPWKSSATADSLSFLADASPFSGRHRGTSSRASNQPGDRSRRLTGVAARTGRIFLKEYESPKRLPSYLVVDTSASMCVTSQPQSKYAWAVKLAGALALASLARISPVGLISGGEREFDSHATLARARVFLWLHRLRRYRLDEQTTVGRKLRQLAQMLESRALVIVLSDLHDRQACVAEIARPGARLRGAATARPGGARSVGRGVFARRKPRRAGVCLTGQALVG